jgi:hypothetical protein
MDESPKRETNSPEESLTKSSRAMSEMSQFIGPFTVNTAQDSIEAVNEQIDTYITEHKSHIKGDYPDGFTILYKQKELKRLQKIRKMRDYRDLTLQALEKEPTSQEEQGPDDGDQPNNAGDGFDD